MHLVEHLSLEHQEEQEIQDLLPPFQKIIKAWINQLERVQKVGVIAYIPSWQTLLGITFRTSLNAKIGSKLLDYVESYNRSHLLTEEAYLSLVDTRAMSTSHMIAHSPTESAGVRLSGKRKFCLDAEDDSDLSEDDLFVSNSHFPTCKTSSIISIKKGDVQHVSELQDEWKEYRMVFRLFKARDLKDLDPRDHWKKSLKWMTLNFDEKNTKMLKSIELMQEAVKSYMKKKQKRHQKTQQTMLDIMMENPTCPIHGVFNHPLWLKNEQLKFKNAGHTLVQDVTNNWSKQLCTWTIHDFNVLYTDPKCKPIFSAGYGQVKNYYYDVHDSLDILIELLNFQFHDDQEAILCFITDLYNILERKLPKLNSILVKSPPSGGKNFFFDCVKDYFLNVGHLCRANKYSGFPFQDAEGRRIVLWNEPNYSPEFIENLKELLGGDSCTVSVKYKAEAPIYRTPFILLTNSDLSIIYHPAFKDRMKVYNWSAAPILKELTKKPTPLATYELFKHYNMYD